MASCQVWEAGSGHCDESSKHPRKFRVETLSVNTLRGRVCEAVKTLSCRKVDVCCIEETLYHGGNRCTIKGKDTRYNLYWSGNDRHCWCRSIYGRRVDRESFWGAESLQQNHLNKTYSWPACEYHSVCECPTEWSSDEIKDLFFDQLGAVTARIPGFEFLILWGDWNGHVCHAGTGYREVHGAMGPGWPVQITSDMFKKAISQMKTSKALCPTQA